MFDSLNSHSINFFLLLLIYLASFEPVTHGRTSIQKEISDFLISEGNIN